jgi:lipoprotein-releasing system permease protein
LTALHLLFARRYFTAKKSVNAINIIAWISVVAIAVVTTALLVVFSVFNGFEDLVKGLYSDFYADVRISAAQGKTIQVSPATRKQLLQIPGVVAIAAVAEEKALLVNGSNQTIVYVKGIDSCYTQVTQLVQNNHIIRGKFAMGSAQQPQLCLGIGIENAIAADVEKGIYPVTLYMPNRQAQMNIGNLADALNSFNALPTSTFMVQQEFDSKYVFTNIDFVKYMLAMSPNECSALELKVMGNDAKLANVCKQLQQVLGKSFIVQTRYQQNQSLFSTMQIEKWVIYAITCLILSVAAFNIVGALTMLVLEKQKDIAVLQAIGANNGFISQIFLSEGLLLAFVGTTIGALLGTAICLAQLQWHLVPLSGGTFIIDYYPVKLLWTDYALIISTVFGIALVAAYFPAQKAGRQMIQLKS